MKRNRQSLKAAMLTCLLGSTILVGVGQARAAKPVSLAVLDFDTSRATGLGDEGGEMLATLLSARLSVVEGVRLVERTTLQRALQEQALGLAGMVERQSAAQVGRLIGAQVLVTGRAFTISNKLLVTARLIGTETGYLHAVAKEGRGDAEIMNLMDRLAEEIGRVLSERRAEFLPVVEGAEDVTKLAHALSGMTLPRVVIRVRETIMDVETKNSVAESELTSLLLAMNLEVIQTADAELPAGLKEYLASPRTATGALDTVDVVIFGQAIGEFGLRTGNLVSANGQVKFAAVDAKTKRVLAVSDARQKGVDVAAQGAAVQAITEATREGARDLVPKLVRAWNRKH